MKNPIKQKEKYDAILKAVFMGCLIFLFSAYITQCCLSLSGSPIPKEGAERERILNHFKFIDELNEKRPSNWGISSK